MLERRGYENKIFKIFKIFKVIETECTGHHTKTTTADLSTNLNENSTMAAPMWRLRF